MSWRVLAALASLVLIAAIHGDAAATQHIATICSTQWGWCPLADRRPPAGTPCQCFVPPASVLPGVAMVFNYWIYHDRQVSPYLNPPWTDPPPPPRVIK